MAIQFRRGNEADLVQSNLLAAEPAYSFDTERFLIGNGSGGVSAVPTTAEVISIANDYVSKRIPIGTILPFGGGTAPEGTLLCNGEAVSRADYADLFAEIGISYGSGNGTTTFNVPDLRGRIPTGYDSTQTEFNALGKTGGEKISTIGESNLPGRAMVRVSMTNAADSAVNDGSGTGFRNVCLADAAIANPGTYTYSQPFNNLPPYTVTNYIIVARAGTSTGDIESALADLVSETESARDGANAAAGAANAANAAASDAETAANAANAATSSMRKTYATRLPATASSDTVITLTDCANASDFNSVLVKGKSTQAGTPTPDAPVAVTGVTPTTVLALHTNKVARNLHQVSFDVSLKGAGSGLTATPENWVYLYPIYHTDGATTVREAVTFMASTTDFKFVDNRTDSQLSGRGIGENILSHFWHGAGQYPSIPVTDVSSVTAPVHMTITYNWKDYTEANGWYVHWTLTAEFMPASGTEPVVLTIEATDKIMTETKPAASDFTFALCNPTTLDNVVLTYLDDASYTQITETFDNTGLSQSIWSNYNNFRIEDEKVTGVLDEMKIMAANGPVTTSVDTYTLADYALPALSAMYNLPNGVMDSYDAISGVETRNIVSRVFDGSADEMWGDNPWLSTANSFACSIVLSDKAYGLNNMLCSHFAYATYIAGINGVCGNTISNVIYFSLTGITTMAQWKSWLAAHPITVYYQLATPTTTQHTPQIIPQPNLNANIFTDINSPVSVDYSRDITSAMESRESALALKADKARGDLIIPTLLNSWGVYTAISSTFGYYVSGDGKTVTFVGAIIGGTGTNTMFTLASGFRPLHRIDHSCIVGGAFGSILIDPNGNVYKTAGTNGTWVSLEGVSFRIDI